MKKFYKTTQSVVFQEDFYDWKTGELISPIETQNYAIIQVAELYFNNSFEKSKHLQICDLEITYPITNGLICETNNKADKLLKHEIYLSFKGEKHSLYSRNGARYQTFAINFKNNRLLLDKLRAVFNQNKGFFMPNLSHYFTSIITEFLSEKQEFFLERIDGLITEILVLIARTENTIIKDLSCETSPVDYLNYLDEHFLDIYSLDELSSHFGYTYGHICKTFKNAYNVTPVEYLLKKKMEYSLLLLKQGKSLLDIAEITGYSSPYNFSRAFKKHYGVSPKNFKIINENKKA